MAKGIKTGGRKKGVQNKDTSEIRKNFQSLIENNLETLQSDLKQLEPKDRIKAILDLSRFVLPTLKATELSTSTNGNINPVVISLGNGIKPANKNGTDNN
ncbi:hypothetical protein MC378_07345 [Polaribacter sp. MSW13]|uniref:Uncharacterized protein n=1 Tax=Polaribacter marinus TaxID=2916838 RepID=A0A9X1VMQ1_9FLAO|nr:hypothetical protein [Polaribacter marinus]MCI2228977.1 hypothetical protein [Polaribacter marinus]